MGSATEQMRHGDHERPSAPVPSMASSTSSTPATAPRWRIMQRLSDSRDVLLTPIDAETLHALYTPGITAHHRQTDDDEDHSPSPALSPPPSPAVNVPPAPGIVSSASERSNHKNDPANRDPTGEVVALEEGELDPLGAFAMGVSLDDGNTRKSDVNTITRSASVSMPTTTSVVDLEDGNATIKQQWKVHKDRVLAKLSDETFTIKASMLETNDMESELSYASTTEYTRREDDDPLSTTTDGLHVIRKTRARLEQLERRHSSSSSLSTAPSSNTGTVTRTIVSQRDGSTTKVVEISQRDYVARIKQMEADLASAWKQNYKVQALRIAIKCVKHLSDTSSAPQLYPCAFVLVSDVLDVFGQLVFERIKARAGEDENGQPLATPLSDHFTSDQVNIHAKETCRNWFYKTACIRELLPRIYIEIALLKSYKFLCDGEFPQIVARISNMIKGIAEPMVALYTRLYLALASCELVHASDKTAVVSSLSDSFFTFQQYQAQGKLTKFLDDQSLTQNEYLELHSPAIEWLMKCCAQGEAANHSQVFESLLFQYTEYSDNSMVLKHLCEAFGCATTSPSYASNPSAMLQLMRTSSPSQFSKCHLYSVLAIQLSHLTHFAPLTLGGGDGKLAFLNDAWSSITMQEEIDVYMECCAAYMKLIVAHYTHREAMILLKDVVRHLNAASPQQMTFKVYNLMGALIENVVFGAQQHGSFFVNVIPSSEFLCLMGMFRRDASVSVAKKVLQAFVNTTTTGSSSSTGTNLGLLRLHVVGPEAAVAHTLFAICCRVHDALDSLSTLSERQEATKDILAFISKLGYAKKSHTVQLLSTGRGDGELQEEEEALLMLYIDCRSAFYKLEPIKLFLTKYVIALAVRVRDRMSSSSSTTAQYSSSGGGDRRRDFIKSCQAYAHITIPSIACAFARLQLLVLCAKLAVFTNCLPQLEAFAKSAIMAVAELRYDEALASTTTTTGELSIITSFSVADEHHDVVDPVCFVLKELVAVLVYAPSLVEQNEPFYFVDALKKAILERMNWCDEHHDASTANIQQLLTARVAKIRLLISFVELYGLWGQRQLPHRIQGVDSNDVLYVGDVDFQQHTQRAFSSTIDQIVREIESLDTTATGGESSGRWQLAVWQTQLLVEFVTTIFAFLSFDEELQQSLEQEQEEGTATTRRNSRSGATLLRKCLLYAHGKLQLVVATPTPTATAAAHQDSSDENRRKGESLRVKYMTLVASLRGCVEKQVNKKNAALLMSASARKALDELDQTLLALMVAV